LGGEGLSVSISLREELGVFVDFILSGVKIDGSLGDTSLEFGEFCVQLGNSFFEFGDVLGFELS